MMTPAELLDSSFLRRETDARYINEIINHPSVRSTVLAPDAGVLDLTAVVANRANVVLTGEHGGVIFIKKMPGLYEMHTAVLPEGRGRWMVAGSEHAFHYMFTQTDCIEILTLTPRGNIAAKAGAQAVGMTNDWTCDLPVESSVYTLHVQNWAKSDRLRDVGEWFHIHMKAEYFRLGRVLGDHSPDNLHDAVTGAAVSLIHGGQAMKGLSIYNRWACMSGHPLVTVASTDPATQSFTLNMGECFVSVHDGTFEVI